MGASISDPARVGGPTATIHSFNPDRLAYEIHLALEPELSIQNYSIQSKDLSPLSRQERRLPSQVRDSGTADMLFNLGLTRLFVWEFKY